MRGLLLLLTLGGPACGKDPILERAESMDGGASPGSKAPPPPGDAAGGAPPGQAAAPAAVDPAAPAPGDPAQPQPGVPDEPAPGAPDAPDAGNGPHITGPAVSLAGTVALEGWDGAVRIDVFDGDQRDLDGPRPSVVAVTTISSPGAFSVRVPKDSGQVWLGAYADTNANGKPDHDDPQGWYAGNPVETAADADGLVLELGIDAPATDGDP